MKTIITLILLTGLLSCSWVNENPNAQSVSIHNTNELKHCRKTGNISVSVKDRIGFIQRSPSKVLTELQALARNEAIKIKANAISANGPPIQGKQSYQGFYCQ